MLQLAYVCFASLVVGLMAGEAGPAGAVLGLLLALGLGAILRWATADTEENRK
jgi:hypothetical protein